MMSDQLQWAIIIFIIASIGFVVWRHGTANPESTGRLGSKVNEIDKKLSSLHSRIGSVETEVEGIKRDGATIKDIERLEERIQTVRAEIAGHREVSQRTNHSVDRIERLLIEKSLSK